MRILFSTFGSYGDVYPYLAIGGELRRRGHQVTIAAGALYGPKVDAAGLAFHPVRPDVFLEDRNFVTHMMDAKHGAERIVRWLASTVHESYQDVLDAARRADVMVTHPLAFASPLVAQRLRLPWVSTITAPMSMMSAHDPPVLAHAPWIHRLRFLGPRVTGTCIRVDHRQTLKWLRPVSDFRAKLGIEDAPFGGSNSTSLILAMFSQALAAPQPDWPRQAVLTGFPFLDEGELPVELQMFLDRGPAPVVFTLGSSAVGTASDFYRHSLAAAEQLGIRAVFLTGSHAQGLPAVLSDNVIAVPYAPHAPLFSRAAAVVHHGGVGTTGQTMRAGHPMLIVPFGHDQFDNAERMRRLGAAEVLPQSRYTARRAKKRLQLLLNVPSYKHATAKMAILVRAENGSNTAADAIERIVPRIQT